MNRLAGKTALITGAASGIGEAGVKLFLQEGARVAGTSRDRAKLDRLKAQFADAGQGFAMIEADLSDLEDARRVVHETVEKIGGIDILWCNAGMMGPGGIEHITQRDIDETMITNLTSIMISCGEAIPYMRARGGGTIVITSSTSGLVGSTGSPIYAASKFGVIGWAKSLALRLAGDGIRVNILCPGPTATPQMRRVMDEGSGKMSGPEYSEMVLSGVPLGRLGRPDEQARAALWLASDESSFVTGAALPVDGGYTCR
jgi:NAD(P)-dependent dehydrogenase (short-subunit alcohol dehydrogenase family)